jgi:succinate dehydrogenase / fumarate reductase membrane anchor subunit
MVKNVSALGRNGVHDFLLIRASAIIMVLYIVYLSYFFITEPMIDFRIWKGFWSSIITQVFTMLALVSILIHGWIGMWQVLTDYIKCARIRSLLQLGVVGLLLGYIFFGFFVLWGVK